MKKLSILLISFYLLFATASAFDPMQMPMFDHYVNDYSEVLSTSQKDELDALAKNIEEKTTDQVVTVLFPNRNGNELIDIGLKSFRENGIGQKKKNNGILLLISTEEKKIRIVTGYGMEGDVPDVLASDIIEKDIRPFVNNGDFYTGVKHYYSRISKAIGTDEGKQLIKKQRTNIEEAPPFVMFVFGIIIGLMFGWNMFSALFGLIFLSIAIIQAGAFALVFGYLTGIALIMTIGFLLVPGLRKTFFSMNGPGGSSRGGGSWGGGGGGGGGGFSGGGGSSGGGGAGD